MTAAPQGLSKSADENTDAIANAAAKPRAQRTKAEQDKISKAVKSKKTTDAKAKVTTGSPKEGEVLPKAEPEAVSTPEDNAKPAESDDSTPTGAARPDSDPVKDGPATFDVPPVTPGPNDTVPEGQVHVTRNAKEGEQSDPGGHVTEVRKAGRKRAPKKDPLSEVDLQKLPVAVTVGQVTISVEEYAGRPVLSLSLVGWVGDAPMKVLAQDVGEVEQAIAEIRSQLS